MTKPRAQPWVPGAGRNRAPKGRQESALIAAGRVEWSPRRYPKRVMSDDSNKLIKDVRKTADSTIVVLDGDVDMRRSPDLHAALIDVARERPKRLILNLTDVPYMDSSGVGTLVEVYRRVSGYDGKFVLFGLTHRVRSVLEITKLDRFFTIRETEEEAARA